MFPFFSLFGREIPLYGLMFVLAAVVSIGFSMIRAKQKNISVDDTLYTGLFAVIGAIIGAKLLFIITMIKPVISNWDKIIESNVSIWKVIFSLFATGGFVFFGGLIGGTLGGIIYLKIFKLSISEYADLIAPCVPLAHAIGRVGCFLGGCCYGIETHFGTELNLSPVAPHNVRLLPVQLIETDVNLLLVLILLIYERRRENKGKDKNKNNKNGKSMLLYIILYSVSRFVLEFFRGDKERGVFFGVSTSQIISIILFVGSVCFMAVYSKRKKFN